MPERQPGEIITFYSYKGGTGRTMALANVAWILASAGKRVLTLDWDLEAPGLYRFFAPFLDEKSVLQSRGVIDLVRGYEDKVHHHPETRSADWVERLARVGQYTIPIGWDFPNGGSLELLSAGRQDGNYSAALSNTNWDDFYGRLKGGIFFDAMRQDIRSNYDYALIDSRTGFSDVADICTQHLPDTLVDCFTLSNQGIVGAAQVAAAVATYGKPEDGRRIKIFPVAMRVDDAEQDKVQLGQRMAMRRFADLPAGLSDAERLLYFTSVAVPYRAYYAYEEILATFGDVPGNPTSLLSAYERLTSRITDGLITALPSMTDSLRAATKLLFERRRRPEQREIFLEYVDRDQVWGAWIKAVLEAMELPVVDPGPVETWPGDFHPDPELAVMAVVSPSHQSVESAYEPSRPGGPPTVVLVAGASRPRQIQAGNTLAFAGPADELDAARRVLSLAGLDGSETASLELSWRARFPGNEPRWFEVPVSKTSFTGRSKELRDLRAALMAQGEAVVLPVAIEGMGGVGKTSLALEYVQRYKNAYDLVWWIAAVQPQFIDAQLADLGTRLGLPMAATAVDAAAITKEALRRDSVTARWLVVFDNADDIEEVARFLPNGGSGHVLITSRNRRWSDFGTRSVAIDVFRREESVTHLRGRVREMSQEEAATVADAVGDLPIAVAAAGAWLADTSTPVADYVRLLQEGRISNEEDDDGLRRRAPNVWAISLERLRERSPAAYHLLQICSVLAPEISSSLINSDHMMETLKPLDARLSDRMMLAGLVQQINRLSLLRQDNQSKQIQVHLVIQEAVRRMMNEQELAATRHEAHLLLAKSRPAGEPDNPETWREFRLIWPHLSFSQAESSTDESVRRLLIDRVRYLWLRGDHDQGYEFGQEVAAQWRALLDAATEPEAPDVLVLRAQYLHLVFNITNILRERAEFTEARKQDEETLAAQISLLGPDHPYTLMTAGGLTADLRALGLYQEALDRDQETYRRWVNAIGEDYFRTLSSANNLAASYRAMGEFRRAREIDEGVVTRRKIVLGSTHPFTLFSRSSLGRDMREAGDYDESVSYLEDVLAVARDSQGDDVAVTLTAQSNLAASLRSAGHPKRAGELLDAAYEGLSDRFGPNSPNSLACRFNRAANLLALEETDAARTEMEAVTAAYERTLTDRHPFTLVCFSNQSGAARAQGQTAQARGLADRAHTGLLDRLGPDHPFTLAAAMNVLTCRFELGDHDGLQDELELLSQRMGELLGSNHPDVLTCRANLALVAFVLDDDTTEESPAPEVDVAVDELSSRLGARGANHPMIHHLRSRQLIYRVLDPQDPF